MNTPDLRIERPGFSRWRERRHAELRQHSPCGGSKLRIDLNNGSSADNLNIAGTADITNSRLQIFVNGTINIGDTFTIISNDGGDLTTGHFVGLSTMTATNDPRYVFTINYNVGDDNDIQAVLSSIVTTNLVHIDGDGLVTFASADNLDNHLSVTRASGNYVITYTAGNIALTAEAQAAGWSGGRTTTVTGPITGVTAPRSPSAAATMRLMRLDAGDVPVTITGTGSGFGSLTQ